MGKIAVGNIIKKNPLTFKYIYCSVLRFKRYLKILFFIYFSLKTIIFFSYSREISLFLFAKYNRANS